MRAAAYVSAVCVLIFATGKRVFRKAAGYPYLMLPILVNPCEGSTPLIGNAVAFAALRPVAQFGAIGKPNGAQLPAIGAVP